MVTGQVRTGLSHVAAGPKGTVPIDERGLGSAVQVGQDAGIDGLYARRALGRDAGMDEDYLVHDDDGFVRAEPGAVLTAFGEQRTAGLLAAK